MLRRHIRRHKVTFVYDTTYPKVWSVTSKYQKICVKLNAKPASLGFFYTSSVNENGKHVHERKKSVFESQSPSCLIFNYFISLFIYASMTALCLYSVWESTNRFRTMLVKYLKVAIEWLSFQVHIHSLIQSPVTGYRFPCFSSVYTHKYWYFKTG
jgi:hypothetical protein